MTRLIDAEQFGVISLQGKSEEFIEGVKFMFDKIHEAPTVERPHGEWIDEDYGIGKCWATCSECGESTNGEAQDHGFGYDYSFPNFCPNCGADMRDKKDDLAEIIEAVQSIKEGEAE